MTHDRTAPLWLAIALLTLALIGGCKEKSTAGSTTTSGAARSTTDQFTDNLADADFVNYMIPIGGSGTLTYRQMKFRADGTWRGNAELDLADEPFECTETGTWQFESGGAIDANTARLLMVMDDTDCPGREAPSKWKVEIRLKGKGGRHEIVDL